MDGKAFQIYLKEIGQELASGKATEHTYCPALKRLLEALADNITATNEPKRGKCGAPDYIVTRGEIPLGYVEAKDIGVSLDQIESGEQLVRYRNSLSNLILTDYLEFRWYVGSEPRLTARLSKADARGNLKFEADKAAQVAELLQGFLHCDAPSISNPKGLATRMAALARVIREVIREAFKSDGKSGALHDQFEAFQKVLLHDLTPEQFADMYAQTIGYGLFAARCHARTEKWFTRQNAAYLLPKTNPFLRQLFGHIAGPELDERITWAVDDLAELLARADMAAILTDFGKSTGREDPVVHFYETFLAAYDPKMREARGVYYTPETIVSYIVRSVDHILKNDFKLAEGLADATRIKLKRGKQTLETHKVQILDPAVGTATFLYSVIQHIRDTFRGNEGLWSGYVRDHLLPRLYGFELLMAPYAIAHMKLGLQLQQCGYDFKSEERVRVYLTNTLEEAHELTGLPLFTQWLAEEANQASEVKQEAPIMVVLGNPPYSNFGMMNRGKWIRGLLQDYKRDLNEKKLNLDDDFIKFIRFGQWRIEQTGYGILAYVTNHTYLDGLTHRRMRESLMETFDDIYLLDLHGNSKKKEKAPDGAKDKNVFDIQQGVAIGIFVKRQGRKKETPMVRHAELWGTREGKYEWLHVQDIASTPWQQLKPSAPHFFFVPKSFDAVTEYEQGWSLNDIFQVKQNGIKTDRDDLFFDFEREVLEQRMRRFYSPEALEFPFREQYRVENSSSYDLLARRERTTFDADALHPCFYRPFDVRWLYYAPGLTSRPGWEVMRHMLAGENLGFLVSRQLVSEFRHVLAFRGLANINAIDTAGKFGSGPVFPLYLYFGGRALLTESRHPNLAPAFIKDVSQRLKLTFIPDGQGDLINTFVPKDIFNYIYAVLHSPTYRRRYAEFLKIDFPRIPLTTNVHLFKYLSRLGEELVALHLMEKTASPITRYPVAGDNKVDQVRYTEPGIDGTAGRVWINKTQYFEGMPPEVWGYHIGGYQVAQKWLKDRKGRQLTYDDLTHYQRITSALVETLRIQNEIDRVIGKWPVS